MKVIIAGSRNCWPTYGDISRAVSISQFAVGEVVSGGCPKGADQAGEWWAKTRGLTVTRFEADWGQHGKSAGPIRNAQMAEYAEGAVVFWDGHSRGARNLLQEMARRRKPVQLAIPEQAGASLHPTWALPWCMVWDPSSFSAPWPTKLSEGTPISLGGGEKERGGGGF